MPVGEGLLKEVAKRAVPLHDHQSNSLSGLVEFISKARVVMLGEASHGTHDFYEWRSLISQRLIAEHGFEFVAIEGDWPASQTVNKKLLGAFSSSSAATAKNKKKTTENKLDKCETSSPSASGEVLKKAFRRWPTWMWANKETESFIDWLKLYNEESGRKVRFYGLDLYSLFESMDVVISELERLDPELAEKAKAQYACFHQSNRDEQEYMNLLSECPEGCKAEVIRVLQEIRKKRFRVKSEEEEEVVRDIKQNAKVAVDAEKYYRTVMFGSGSESWNVRDRHMMETLELLVQHTPDKGRAIVWAHNTHIGDYRYTSMEKQGSVNIGGLARLRYGEEEVALVGFGTYKGSVVASNKWTGPVQKLRVPEAKPDSFEDILHKAAGHLQQFYLLFGPPKGKKAKVNNNNNNNNNGDNVVADAVDSKNTSPSVLLEWRGNRAIGVVYEPLTERWGNYVPTCLARRYDAFVFFDSSQALLPLSDEYDIHEVPEAWPTGV